MSGARTKRVAACLLGVVGLPLALELGLRATGFSHPPLERPVVYWDGARDVAMHKGEDVHQVDSDCLWIPRPGAPVPDVEGERINGLSMRGPQPSASRAPETPCLATLGDSSTFGWRTPFAETYTGILHDRLDLEAIAAGVIGYTCVQGRRRYGRDVEPHRPDVVTLAFGAVNEFGLSEEGGDVRRIEIHRARRGIAYRARLGLLHSSRSAQALQWLFEGGSEGRQAAIEAWADQQALNVSAWEVAGEKDAPVRRRVQPGEFREVLLEFVDAIRAGGARPILIAMPRRAEFEAKNPVLLEYDQQLRRVAEDRSVPLVDAHGAFRSHADPDELFFDNVHPTPAGHAVLADLLEPVLLEVLKP